MTRSEFLKLSLVPGLVMVEPKNGDYPCASMVEQVCRVVVHAHGYSGPIDVGTLVVLADRVEGPVKWWHGDNGPGDGLPLMILPLSAIMAVVKP